MKLHVYVLDGIQPLQLFHSYSRDQEVSAIRLLYSDMCRQFFSVPVLTLNDRIAQQRGKYWMTLWRKCSTGQYRRGASFQNLLNSGISNQRIFKVTFEPRMLHLHGCSSRLSFPCLTGAKAGISSDPTSTFSLLVHMLRAPIIPSPGFFTRSRYHGLDPFKDLHRCGSLGMLAVGLQNCSLCLLSYFCMFGDLGFDFSTSGS